MPSIRYFISCLRQSVPQDALMAPSHWFRERLGRRFDMTLPRIAGREQRAAGFCLPLIAVGNDVAGYA